MTGSISTVILGSLSRCIVSLCLSALPTLKVHYKLLGSYLQISGGDSMAMITAIVVISGGGNRDGHGYGE